MTPALGQRLVILAGAALLALVAALAVAALAGGEDGTADRAQTVLPAGSDWYDALAAPYRLDTGKKRTVCGYRAGPKTLGVAHPVLPCGAKLYLEFGDKEVLTQVIDRGTGLPGRQFDLTAALARELGLQGVQLIRWRFAARPAR
jgi:hypothetical protein